MQLLDRVGSNVINTQIIQSVSGQGAYAKSYDLDRFLDVEVAGYTAPRARTFSSSDATSKQIMQMLQEKRTTMLTSQWQRHVFDTAALSDFDTIFETFESVFRLIDEAGPSRLHLKGFDVQRTNGEHLVAALRASFRWRHEVPGWREAVQVARAALLRAGLDAESALEGLD